VVTPPEIEHDEQGGDVDKGQDIRRSRQNAMFRKNSEPEIVLALYDNPVAEYVVYAFKGFAPLRIHLLHNQYIRILLPDPGCNLFGILVEAENV